VIVGIEKDINREIIAYNVHSYPELRTDGLEKKGGSSILFAGRLRSLAIALFLHSSLKKRQQ